MKKVALVTLLTIGCLFSVVDAKTPSKDKDDYQWLIDEVSNLYDEEVSIGDTFVMVYVYDKSGNEILSFNESAYDTLSSELKRKVSKSDLLFEAMGDKFYIISE